REVWEFVNLYSKTRGCNRFHAVIRALDLLRERNEVVSRGVDVPYFPALLEWVKRESKLGNATLDAEVLNGNDGLVPIKTWSDAVNDSVKDIAHGVPPFPLVREMLVEAAAKADCMVISQTPTDALEREWTENQIEGFVSAIAGQEMGTKTQHLDLAAKDKYGPGNILMIGDAPGDHNATKATGALFFPINPGDEEASWKCLLDEGLENFFCGTFAGDYQQQLLADFEKCLPENPTW
ncbi:MAG: HAD hydrolase-like protein, partial [Verrucomicrobiales bacterium]|nr:HAD hydrolase-like protein [Verrucomicrobiales bacterium]